MCSGPQIGKPWCFPSFPMNPRVFQVQPALQHPMDPEPLVRLTSRPIYGGWGKAAGTCSRQLFQALPCFFWPRSKVLRAQQQEAMQSASGRAPTSLGACFPRGQAPTCSPGCPTISSASNCEYQLSSDQEKAGRRHLTGFSNLLCTFFLAAKPYWVFISE